MIVIEQIGKLLRCKKYITQAQLDSALEQQRRNLNRLGRVLVKNGVVSPRQYR